MPDHADETPQPVLRPVTTRTAGQVVADRLVTAIALGQFALGERLPPERELAATLQVSRSTLREAVAELVDGGYVSVRRGRAGGIFVESMWGREAEDRIHRTLVPDWERLEQLLDFRAMVESQVARVAAQRRTSRDIEVMRTALDAYLAAGQGRKESSAADLRLHQAVAAATANPYLVELSLRVRNDVTLGIGAEPWSPQLRSRGVEQHPELVGAVIDGDAARAAELAGEHFSLTEHTLRDLVAAVARQGAGDAPVARSRRGDHAHRRP